MTQADEKHLTLVCYRGGYGGDFFCALLDEALQNSKFIQRDVNNRYVFNNYIFASNIDAIKSLNFIFLYYRKIKNGFIDSLLYELDWADGIKKIHDMCYDEDESAFFYNVSQYLKDSLFLPNLYNVGNLHVNLTEFEYFDVRNIHNNMNVIFLDCKNELYSQYFRTFSHIKTGFSVLKKTKVFEKEHIVWKAPEYAHIIDVGELFFENIKDSTISNTLSRIVGKEIKIDLDELESYRSDNDKLLIRYFGKDYKHMNVYEFKEKRFKLYDRVRNGEAY